MAIYGPRGKYYIENRPKYLTWVILVMHGNTLKSIGNHYGVSSAFVRACVVREIFMYFGEHYSLPDCPKMDLPAVRKKHKHRIIEACRCELGWKTPTDNNLVWQAMLDSYIVNE